MAWRTEHGLPHKVRAASPPAVRCLPHGAQVSSWTRTPHDLEGVTCYHGPGELEQVRRRGRECAGLQGQAGFWCSAA